MGTELLDVMLSVTPTTGSLGHRDMATRPTTDPRGLEPQGCPSLCSNGPLAAQLVLVLRESLLTLAIWGA